MWPLLFCLLASTAIIVQRILWWRWLAASTHVDVCQRIERALSDGELDKAKVLAAKVEGPYSRMIAAGLTHINASMLGAMQVQAADELERARKLQWVLSTFITMAPLLGLIGTVVGIMSSFNFVGDEALAATKVSGGIAEALIATASGLGIAILCLLPYNYFNKRISSFRMSLEQQINRLEVAVESAKSKGLNFDK